MGKTVGRITHSPDWVTSALPDGRRARKLVPQDPALVLAIWVAAQKAFALDLLERIEAGEPAGPTCSKVCREAIENGDAIPVPGTFFIGEPRAFTERELQIAETLFRELVE